MAKASGLSSATVQRIWRAFGLQPHRVETFKLSTDPVEVCTRSDGRLDLAIGDQADAVARA